MLTFRVGDPERPRGHALLFFHDADEPQTIWATYLVVTPIAMDLGKYLPAAFAPQIAAQVSGTGPAAYPLPPVPEKVDGGLAALERLAELRGDDLLDGGVLRLNEPWQVLQPIAGIGAEYAEQVQAYLTAATTEPEGDASPPAQRSNDVDDLLLQVMPDREKIGRVARLAGTLRYASEGGDRRQVDETLDEMRRVTRRLPEKYRLAELLEAAQRDDPRSALLSQLYLDRAYKMADEDYQALAELDRKIEELNRSGRADEQKL